MLEAHQDHRRAWKDFRYVYPVISRRAGGVSIGIDLNPDKICNFNCIYCEVNRLTPPRTKKVDLKILENELRAMIQTWKSGELFKEKPFASVSQELRRLNDISFSGSGEPTTCPLFADVVQIAFDLRNALLPPETKLILITDAACLNRPAVKTGLRLMQQGKFEIWAKLDAGTEDYYKLVNRSAIPFQRILKNITETSLWLPLTIQSLFLRVHGKPPPDDEIKTYCDRIREILAAGGNIQRMQLYTTARPTPEPFASPLSRSELDHIASIIKKQIPLPQILAYGHE